MKIKILAVIAILAVIIPAMALALTSDQVRQIIDKLNSYGANASIIATVQSLLNNIISADKIIVSGNNFVNSKTGQIFYPRGNTYLKPMSKSILQNPLYVKEFWGFNFNEAKMMGLLEPGDYNSADVNIQMQKMKSMGYNTIRVFISNQGSSAPFYTYDGAHKVNPAYLNNIADYIGLAKKNGLYVTFVGGLLPETYWDIAKPAQKPDNIEGYNALFMYDNYITAFGQYLHDIVAGIKSKDPSLMNTVLSMEILDEFQFTSDAKPFSITSGTVNMSYLGKTYDMSSQSSRQQLSDDAANYFVDHISSSIKSADSSMLVTVSLVSPLQQGRPSYNGVGKFAGKLYAGTAESPRVKVMNNSSSIDYIDLHLYPYTPGVVYNIENDMKSSGIQLNNNVPGFADGTPIKKPMITGEFALDKANYPAIEIAKQKAMELLDNSYKYGYKGWMYFIWANKSDEEAGFYSATQSNGLLGNAISPNNKNNIGTSQLQSNAINLISSSAPETANKGSKFVIGCDYGMVLPCITPASGAGKCVFTGYDSNGTKALFNCTASNAGAKENFCTIFNYSKNAKCVAQKTKIHDTNIESVIDTPASCQTALTAGDKKIPVLMYHWVCDGTEPECQGGKLDLYVSSARLREQMAALKSAGYESITDQDYYAWRRGTKSLPVKPIMFVWDDGWKSSLTKAAPILKEFGYSGVSAVITNLVGSNWRYMTWDEIRALRENFGWSIASHTTDHCSLANFPAGNRTCSPDGTLDGTLKESRTKINQEIGVMPITLIHPGNSWNAVSAEACSIYYPLCFTSVSDISSPRFLIKKSNLAGSATDRITVTGDITGQQIVSALSCETPIIAQPTISVSSATCTIAANQNTCTSTISWNATGYKEACVYVLGSITKTYTLFGCKESSSVAAPWISYGGDTFDLRESRSPTSKLLNSVTLRGTSGQTTPALASIKLDKTQYQSGDTAHISWTSADINNILIIWSKASDGTTGWITPANSQGRHIIDNNGSYFWTIPSDFSVGQFIVQVFNYDPNTPGAGGTYASNPTANSGTFNIVAPSTASITKLEIKPIATNWTNNAKAYGSDISVYAPIRNTGGIAATNVRIDWYYDSKLIKSPIIASVPANSSFINRAETALALPKPAIGAHSVKMYVTFNGVRQETSLTFTVSSAIASIYDALVNILAQLRVLLAK